MAHPPAVVGPRFGSTSRTSTSASPPSRLARRRSISLNRSERALIASATGSGRWIQSRVGALRAAALDADDVAGVADDGRFAGHVGDDDRVGADLRSVADRDRPEQLRARSDRDVVLDGRMALAALEAGAAEGDALVDRHAVADLGRLADDDAGSVVDEEVAADPRAGMDLDPGQGAGRVDDHPRAAPWRRSGAARARRGGRGAPGPRPSEERIARVPTERAAGSRSRAAPTSARTSLSTRPRVSIAAMRQPPNQGSDM